MPGPVARRGGWPPAVAAALALAVGLLVAGLAQGFPALAGGGLGAFGFAITYCVVWFFGVRWLDRRAGQ